MQTLVLFDIGSNRLRNRVARACRDVGMDRLQYSVFLGELQRDRLERLRDRLAREIEHHIASEKAGQRAQALRLHLFPIDETSFGKAHTLTRAGLATCTPRRWPDILIL